MWTRENTDAALKPACPFPCRHRQCQGATALLPEPGCCLRNLQRSLRRDSTRWTELACKLFASLECGVAFFLRGQRRASLGPSGGKEKETSGPSYGSLSLPVCPSDFIFFCMPASVSLSFPLAKAFSSMYFFTF